MGGWGEPKGISGDLVQRALERRLADLMADRVANYLNIPTTRNRELLEASKRRYEQARGPRVRERD